MNYLPNLLCDFYKISHKEQYPEGTEFIYSTLTPRSNKYMPGIDKVTVFGIQYFIKEYLVDYFKKNFFDRKITEVTKEYRRVIKGTLGYEPDTTHIAELWKLGYLPIEIKALKEGTQVPMRVPVMTIENTRPEFFWLTNFLETLLSSEVWQPMTAASIAAKYHEIGAYYADKTVGNREHLPFQFHDFSFRGMEGLNAAANSGAGHLLSFVGTDTIPSILFHEKYYGANIDKELVGTSIPATEHSVMCANGKDEEGAFRRLINDVYPSGLVSIVADTWDFWGIINNVLPKLKDDIMARDGKVVIRPDSGDPANILCGKNYLDLTKDEKYIGNNLEALKDTAQEYLIEEVRDETPHGEHGDPTPEMIFQYKGKYYYIRLDIMWNRYDKQYYYIDEHKVEKFEVYEPETSELGLIEALWNQFGGTVNEQGYRELDPHIGAIYGDSITLERAEDIFKRLEEKGFASSNVVLGVGSYTYQMNTRDTFGFAVKATYSEINGEPKLLYKDPKTDDGTKKSQRGKVVVKEQDGEIIFEDGLDSFDHIAESDLDLMKTVFRNGRLYNEQTLSEIRKQLKTK